MARFLIICQIVWLTISVRQLQVSNHDQIYDFSRPTCNKFVNSKLSERNGKLNCDRKSLTKQQILIYIVQTHSYGLVNGGITSKGHITQQYTDTCR